MAGEPAPPPQLILAFDYGTRRIGVASGDTLTRTARGLIDARLCAGHALDRDRQGLSQNIGQPSSSSVFPYNMDGTPTR